MTEETNEVPVMGAILSDPDYRDHIAAASVYASLTDAFAAGQLPQQFETDITQLGKVLSQKQTPSCVSHAWALVMKYWWWKKTGEIVDFSPRFLDILSDETWIPLDGGRVPRTVCKISAKFGCCTMKTLPNDTTLPLAEYRDKDVITPAMYAEAAKYKIPGYIRVPDESVSDFRKIIMRLGLVSGLFNISDNFWKPSRKGEDIDPLQPKRSQYNHQMVVRGWNGIYNKLRNSWGSSWGFAGEGSYSAEAWLPFIYEGWAIVGLPDDLKNLLTALPSPSDFHYTWNQNLAYGDINDDVKAMQIAYMILGILKPVAPDELGIFGPKTAQANLAYQRRKKIAPVAPNNFGPKTRAALNAEFAL